MKYVDVRTHGQDFTIMLSFYVLLANNACMDHIHAKFPASRDIVT